MIPVIEKKWNYIQRWDFFSFCFFFCLTMWWLYILNYTRSAKSILLELQQHTAWHFSISTYPNLWRMDPLEQREGIWGSEQSNEALTTIHVRLHGVLFIQIIDLIGLPYDIPILNIITVVLHGHVQLAIGVQAKDHDIIILDSGGPWWSPSEKYYG